LKQRTQHEIPSPAFKNFQYLIHKVLFLADIAEGETDKDDGNNIENPMGYVFL